MDQAQRRDIDTTLDDRLTLAIDEENIADNPYIFEPSSFVGNNWFKQGSNIVKLNLAEQDSLIFLSSPLVKLLQKDITNVIVSFDYQVSNVSVNYPILSNISLTCMEMTNYMLVENILTTQGHIDVDCSLFNFSSNVVNTSISEQGFKVGINFNGNKSNATIKLSNVQIQFKYNNKLLQQSDSVVNRLEPYVDFWREDDDLVLQIGGDATGKGMDHSGGDVDTYTKSEIDAKLDLKVNTEVGKGLSSNDYTLTEKTKLGTVETNANYYVHPSSHQTGMIVESSALTNLETSENATQHEINLAIDDKINQGGGGSVDIVTAWESTPSDSKVASEKLVKDSLDGKLDNAISSTVVSVASNDDILITDYSDSNKVKRVANILATQVKDSNAHSNIGSSANDTQGTINTNIDTALSNKVSKSSTSGLLKNDGTVDTSTYLTSSALSNYVQKSSTNGLLKNDGTVDTTSYSTFSGSYNDLSNKPSIPSSSSDLSDGSSLVKTSSTSGLIKNDGSIDTNTYLSSSVLDDYVQKNIILYNGANLNDINVTGFYYCPYNIVGTTISNTPNNVQSAFYLLVEDMGANISTKKKQTFTTTSDGKTWIRTKSSGSWQSWKQLSTFSGSYDDLSNKPSIPSSSSDLSDGSNIVKKSSTTGLLKNDGSVDTNSYLTSSSLSDYVQKSSTTGLIKNDGTVDTSAYITSSAISGKEDTSNKVSSWSSTTTDTHYPSEKLVKDSLDDKISKSNTTGLVLNDGSVDSDLYSLLKSIECILLLDDNDCGLYLKRDD